MYLHDGGVTNSLSHHATVMTFRTGPECISAVFTAKTQVGRGMQGRANLLLESYGSAEASFLAGLSIDPTDETLLQGLKLAQKDLQTDQEEGGRQKR